MTVHENESDKTNQQRAMDIIHGWLQALPAVGNNGVGFTHQLIPTVPNKSDADFTLWWNNLQVGVIEIKCRNGDYATWMIDRGKLLTLYDYQRKGFPAMLAFAAMKKGVIKQVYFADLRVLLKDRDRWEDAKEEDMMTTNHGKDRRKEADKGYCIPNDMFWRLM